MGVNIGAMLVVSQHPLQLLNTEKDEHKYKGAQRMK